MAYVVVAVASGPHRGWTALKDAGEIYGVFWVDSALSRPTRLVDVFPTRRLKDYHVWLLRAWGDSVIVCGEGATYGDERMRRSYPTEGPSSPGPAVHVDTVFSRTVVGPVQPCPRLLPPSSE